ncbi:DUF3027 domain-containing protein [Nocardioides sp. WL0053]|jgi:hypothetical protein|uniref:DUF3027 domain-containing protein n=1 Tax=Nocardioides jiangsuensis TaxID=2866161 RepID=A0ABS7RKT2_9ACTN|nr:DUF3027 domain-containing protein [Nocardioides jiangsuensis]MBY9075102.1 DUF3027 domain-containing protein [Nocardioides jiangsuensis]
MAAARTAKPDAVGVGAIDAARTALTDLVDAGDVGEHLGHASEGERVTTHFFACTRAGYRGWRWSVTLVRASRQKTVTLDEVVLLPGDDAIVAPAWVPWRERIQPGDLGPGDLLPTEEDDPRLVPAYLAGEDDLPDDEEGDTIAAVTDELGLGRPRVLSLEGRELAAQRWYDGSHGPEAAIAQSAPGTCVGCGFMVRLAGPLSTLFGVCANAYANDDGRVVSFDHGCGAHSEAQLHKRNLPAPLPEPVLDTLTWDDLEQF